MNTTIRNYEAMYIVDTNLTDEQVDTIIAKFSKVIADQGGEVQAAGRWDKRRLAYEVKGRREGTFILAYFTGEPTLSKELDRVFRISDDILRHLITRVEPQHVDITRIEKPQPAVEAVPEAPVAEAVEEVAVEATEPVPAEAETVEEAPVAEVAAEEVVAEASVEEAPAEETTE